MPGMLGVGLELLAEASDINMEVVGLIAVLRSPHTLQQPMVGEHPVWIGDEHLEQFVLRRAEVDLLAADGNAAPPQVDLNVTSAKDSTLEAGWLRRVAQRDAHPCHQLIEPERLRQVVIGAQIKRLYLLPLLATRGEHHNGRLAALANALDNRGAVEVRQPQIEQHQVRMLPVQRL